MKVVEILTRRKLNVHTNLSNAIPAREKEQFLSGTAPEVKHPLQRQTIELTLE